MDKRRTKAIEEVKQNTQLLLQDRRRILDLYYEINNQENSISLQENHLEDLKIQLNSGVIRQKDKFGNILDKEDLPRTIKIYEMDLIRMKLNLDYLKEDLFFKVHTEDLQKIRDQLNGHYAMVREEYLKIKEVLKNV